MQTVLSRVWICVMVSISYNGNHYATNAPIDTMTQIQTLDKTVCILHMFEKGINLIIYLPAIGK